MEFVTADVASIKKAIRTLKEGGLIIFPCETVYGVAVDCLNASAVQKLNKYKQRPLGKPYAIMCSDQEMANEFVELNETAQKIYKTYLPGPVTVISKGKGKVANGVESESGTLGVRIPDYDFMLKLIKEFGHPIVATSANASYQKRPYKISDIFENISEKQKSLVGLVIDVGELPKNEPSTVIDTTLDDPAVLRQGEIKFQENSKILSRGEENTQNIGKELWQKYESFKGDRAIIFALQGEMGAGKTQFTKGLAKAIGIEELVTSPTFTLENDYKGKERELFHFDAWRLKDGKELNALGFKDLINKDSVIAIEWADRVAEEIRKYHEDAVVVWVKIDYGEKENERLLSWGVTK